MQKTAVRGFGVGCVLGGPLRGMLGAQKGWRGAALVREGVQDTRVQATTEDWPSGVETLVFELFRIVSGSLLPIFCLSKGHFSDSGPSPALVTQLLQVSGCWLTSSF